ncbi:AP-3 complex subunit delta-1-like [Homarus americanus]|uniref:AP-3 complex subunit delta-1-like n=1 Tax=Homarus americanus TaxID=6706 RepID=A0A8J5JMI7_HOMAM|nr:AP-3 complex subunit delta-1-like [Homarus americanus]
MSKILKTHPKSVQAHKDLVLQCLDDKDESIRLRALDLLYGMVTKKTVMEIVRRLMTHMDRAEGTMYRDELLQKIILICSQNNFQYITNFEWYISVLVELCRMEGTQHGGLIASQLMDVAIRVVAVREFTVGQMALLLDNAHVIVGPAAARSSIAEVLYAAAWICGEFSQLLANPKATLESMVRGKVVSLPGHIQAIYVHNMLKLYAHIIATAEEEDDSEMIEEVTTLLLERLPVFVSSGDLEVQERASCIVHVVTLDLDVWINDPPSESEEEEDDAFKKEIFLRDARRAEQASNPYYVKSSAQTSPRPNHNSIQIDEIPVAAIDLNVSLKIPGMTSLDKYQLVDGWQDGSKKRHKKQKKRSKRKGPLTSSSDEEIRQAHVVNTDVGEMPEGAHFSDDNEVDDRPEDDPHRALDIDLDEPLAPNEVLPTRTHYEVHSQKTPEESNEANLQPSQTPTKKKSKNKKDKKEKKEKTKKVKKEQKKVKKKFTGNEENLILDLMDSVKVAAISDETPVAANHINGITDAKNKEKPTDDLDFWLSKDDSSSQAPSEPIVDGTERTASPSSYPSGRDESKSKKTKTKKEKKAKKEKGKDKSEKKKSRKREKVEDSSIRNREEYEETNGTVTQDLEDKPVIPTVQPNNRLLAEDSFLRLDPQSELVNLPWTLDPGESKESQLSFTAEDDTIPDKLRGSLSYIQDGTSSSDLSLRLEFPVTTFLSGKTASRATFTDLLSSGQLSARSSFTIPECPWSFPEVLEEVTRGGSLAVVESVDQTASLYGRSLHGHHVCLLVKYQASSRLTVDGKSTEGILLSNALDHLKTVLMQKQ